MTGAFIDFPLTYKSGHAPGGLSNHEQAVAILTKGRALVAAGHPGAAIIYSANEGQTDDLAKAYGEGKYKAGIVGANQAEVMTTLETLLGEDDWTDLQLKMRIAPITTIPIHSDPLEIVESDLARIRAYLEDGWAVLGWQNQDCHAPDHPYAIGGGVASTMRADVKQAIQGGLRQLARDFPS